MPEAVQINELRTAVTANRIQWHKHALERMLERDISRLEAIETILHGEIIENYPDDRPLPSCLVFFLGAEPIHVVASLDKEGMLCHIITVYRPDLDHFEPDFRTRRKT